jgi:hypothetical protein
MNATMSLKQIRNNLRLNARRVLLAPRDHILWFCYFQRRTAAGSQRRAV